MGRIFASLLETCWWRDGEDNTPRLRHHKWTKYSSACMPLSTSSHLEKNSVQAVGVQRASRSKVSQSFATSSDDAVPCNLREVRRSKDYFKYGGQVDVISHRANSDNYPGEGEVGAVRTGLEVFWRGILEALGNTSPLNDCSLIIT
jgi:hypothetical protein